MSDNFSVVQKRMMDFIKVQIRKLSASGFFYVMLSNILKNVGLFVAGVLLVRFVAKSEYGLYVYANNILSYFMLVSGLGIVSAVFSGLL